jgi:aspartate carbamoyltransferase catalytic subunit
VAASDPTRPVPSASNPRETAARDFLGIEGLGVEEILALLSRAESLLPAALGHEAAPRALAGRVVANLFFEDSTRTRVSFEIAAKRLGAEVVNLSASGSSASKGETLLDTARNIEAMGVDAIVVRTSISGGAALVAGKVLCPVINAGDGRHEHPTQALLDVLTIRERLGAIQGRTIAIVGDIANSRVARSVTHALVALGAKVIAVGPPALLPEGFEGIARGSGSIEITHDLDSIIGKTDAIMMLRIQLERSAGIGIASDYRSAYGLTSARRAKLRPGVPILHPGPVNRGVEIDDAVADDSVDSLILRQVSFGVAARMAVLLRALEAR